MSRHPFPGYSISSKDAPLLYPFVYRIAVWFGPITRLSVLVILKGILTQEMEWVYLGIGILPALLGAQALASEGTSYLNMSRAHRRLSQLLIHSYREISIFDITHPWVAEQLAYRFKSTFAYLRRSAAAEPNPPPIRIFVETLTCGGLAAELKAYPSSTGSSVILLAEDPSETSPLGQFRLYHELGHVAHSGVLKWWEWVMSAYLIPLETVVCLVILWHHPILALAVAPGLLFLNVRRTQYATFTHELNADAFALVALSKCGSGDTIKNIYQSKIEAYKRSHKWLSTPNQYYCSQQISTLCIAMQLHQTGNIDQLEGGITTHRVVLVTAASTILAVLATVFGTVPPAWLNWSVAASGLIMVVASMALSIGCIKQERANRNLFRIIALQNDRSALNLMLLPNGELMWLNPPSSPSSGSVSSEDGRL